MRILIVSAKIPHRDFNSNDSLIQAFKDLGHEVITCGPIIGNTEEPIVSPRDIKVIDKSIHPEYYTYKEILDKCDKTPDFILQVDPHFYLSGDKPKDIKSGYYIVDVHRGADIFRRMSIEGKFDYIFIAQKFFIPIFTHIGLNCFWIPRAHDDTFIKEQNINTECDLVFCGETGISDTLNIFNKLDFDINLRYHDGYYPDVSFQNRYRSWSNMSLEYIERAEILIRLSKDYNLRIYDKTYGENYAKAISRGKILVNHSLWKDSALRNFEVLACNRFLIADNIPFQEELLEDKKHYAAYNQYFSPLVDNFKLEYEEIRSLVDYYLSHDLERKRITNIGKEYVRKWHTFKNRAKTIVDIVEGKSNGYVRPY